ncbi:uncharacterized protein LOC100373324 [Saccoglossus kowalevskii]|uniref:Uncharacterized protein LOC100373324 n=1 Tax=Saccoglossus kowalevskii TaxID=10224 RepID=A0ABM0MD18_SACKO|nr:PREDICTED: uncharacterized protein LOC100373324 [Saccoglossus kowalevskii]
METGLENVSVSPTCKTIVLHPISSHAFNLDSFTTDTGKGEYQTVKLDAATTATFLDNIPVGVSVQDVASIVDPSRLVCMTSADTVGTATDSLPESTTVTVCDANTSSADALNTVNADAINSVVTYRVTSMTHGLAAATATEGLSAVSHADGTMSYSVGDQTDNTDLHTTAHQLLVNQATVVDAQGPHLFEVQAETVSNHLDSGSLGGVPNLNSASTCDVNINDSNNGQGIEEPRITVTKRKGGWPKGKKRKKSAKDTGSPKAPTTAYVLYLNEQRVKVKEENPEMAFTEVTKLLGSQWSSMSAEDKQKYVEEAENDKKRYIDELKAYQQTEAYQAFLKRQAAKKLNDGSSIDSEEVASILGALEDDDPNDLYCKTCNQYFSSLHNKKEHLYGRQHLQTLTGKLCEFERETLELENQQHNNPSMEDSNTMDSQGDLITSPSSSGAYSPRANTQNMTGPVDLEKFKNDFVELNVVREMELRELRRCLCSSQDQNEMLNKQLEVFKEKTNKLECDIDNMKAYGASLQTQLDGLKMVPTLFGVINF